MRGSVFFFVLAAHAFVILPALIFSPSFQATPPPRISQRIALHTRLPPPPSKIARPTSQKGKPPAPRTSATRKKPKVAKKAPPQQESHPFFEEIAKCAAALLDQSDPPIKKKILTEETPRSLPSINLATTQEDILPLRYQSEIIVALQEQLIFPEFGRVDLWVRIDRQGKILDYKIRYSESERNSRYLEQELSRVSLPPRSDPSFAKEKTCELSLTLCNAS